MFWRISNLSSISPVEMILDKENFTLEELLDEEDIIQECKALNTRLINFLRDRAQVEQLLAYIVEDPPEDADTRRAFKFPFVACEIFTCEIDVILKTLVEDEELMDILFSFLRPDRSHSSVLAGYFSKVVVCLMLRKTNLLVKYVQAHEAIFHQLVNLIGITSIMEILVRLVGVDDHMFPNYSEIMQWLADTNLLEMIVDKLTPDNSSEVNANAAEVLSVIIRNAPSALTNKLSSQSFVSRIFDHALNHASSKSSLVQSLSVCIALLDPRRSNSVFFQPTRNQHLFGQSIHVDPGIISAMLPKLSELIKLLSLSPDDRTLPTTFGELRPPFGKHRLKVVEFITVLLETGNEVAEKELIESGAIQRILDLFFEYPYHNLLHHLVENMVISCLESKHNALIDHLFCECDIIGKFLHADKDPFVSCESNAATIPAVGRKAPRAGNIGHITRICNKIVQLGSNSDDIQSYLQKSDDWIGWQTTVLFERNSVENVYRWACGRPTSMHERLRESDDEEICGTDYDVATLANNISEAFRCSIDENEDMDEVNGSLDRGDEDVYFDDGSAEVVFSSLKLGVDQQSLFTNSNWFAFQEETDTDPKSLEVIERMDDIDLNGSSSGRSGSDDQQGKFATLEPARTSSNLMNNVDNNLSNQSADALKFSATDDASFFRFDTADNDDLFSDQGLPEWVGWHDPSDIKVDDTSDFAVPSVPTNTAESTMGESKDGVPDQSSPAILDSNEFKENEVSSPSLFEGDAEIVGIELEGVEKTVERAFEEDVGGNWRGRCTAEELCL